MNWDFQILKLYFQIIFFEHPNAGLIRRDISREIQQTRTVHPGQLVGRPTPCLRHRITSTWIETSWWVWAASSSSSQVPDIDVMVNLSGFVIKFAEVEHRRYGKLQEENIFTLLQQEKKKNKYTSDTTFKKNRFCPSTEMHSTTIRINPSFI